MNQNSDKIKTSIEENALDRAAYSKDENDVIDLGELAKNIWKERIKIILVTSIFGICSYFYSLTLPDTYQSTILLAPTQNEGGGLAALGAQYNSLASLAGINLSNNKTNETDQAMKLLHSWPFLEAFFHKHKLKPQIIAAQDWDKTTNRLVIDAKLYNSQLGKWTRSDKGDSNEPSSWKTYKALSGMISSGLDPKTGMISINVEHISPSVAKDWCLLLADDLNQHFQIRDTNEAQKNIKYLQNKINETSIKDMQTVFYKMIEDQTKSLMLAEVSDEYLLTTVVPPMIAEEKIAPQRGLIIALSTIFGFVSMVLFILVAQPIKQRS